MTIGEWLNRAIMEAAKQSVQGRENTPVSNQLPALPLGELTQAIAALGDQLKGQSDRQSERQDEHVAATTNGVHRAEVEDSLAPVVASVRKLEEDVEAKFGALELGEHIGPMQERMREAEAKAKRATLSLAPLERKVMRLSQQLEKRQEEPEYEPPRRGLMAHLFSD